MRTDENLEAMRRTCRVVKRLITHLRSYTTNGSPKQHGDTMIVLIGELQDAVKEVVC